MTKILTAALLTLIAAPAFAAPTSYDQRDSYFATGYSVEAHAAMAWQAPSTRWPQDTSTIERRAFERASRPGY